VLQANDFAKVQNSWILTQCGYSGRKFLFSEKKTFTCQMGMWTCGFNFHCPAVEEETSMDHNHYRMFFWSRAAGSHGLKWPLIPFSESTA